jgi:hypothetical protein
LAGEGSSAQAILDPPQASGELEALLGELVEFMQESIGEIIGLLPQILAGPHLAKDIIEAQLERPALAERRGLG